MPHDLGDRPVRETGKVLGVFEAFVEVAQQFLGRLAGGLRVDGAFHQASDPGLALVSVFAGVASPAFGALRSGRKLFRRSVVTQQSWRGWFFGSGARQTAEIFWRPSGGTSSGPPGFASVPSQRHL
ncbi:hypothetical protein [Phenylobacterium sp.]|uniref:hypothetical protein n=1 Tax=Phenylobacterium sp. TaxID=1871053 RepID=UPI002E361441|nr:hypothetical protein [Phenylobacterium sp.]HEX4711217.1 hypothetical protein [Phenylobacterium sp.]